MITDELETGLKEQSQTQVGLTLLAMHIIGTPPPKHTLIQAQLPGVVPMHIVGTSPPKHTLIQDQLPGVVPMHIVGTSPPKHTLIQAQLPRGVPMHIIFPYFDIYLSLCRASLLQACTGWTSVHSL